MNSKIKLYSELKKISDNILDNIVAPICGISEISANIWLADIETYVMEDDKKREEVFKQIAETFNLNEEDLDLAGIDAYSPLIMIALFIYLKNRKDPADG